MPDELFNALLALTLIVLGVGLLARVVAVLLFYFAAGPCGALGF